MVNTYEKYLEDEAGNVLKVEDALKLYEAMAKSFVESNTENDSFLNKQWDKCMELAAEYAMIRNRWDRMTREERIAIDADRTKAHDAFIAQLNIISRIPEQKGIDNSWRTELGDARKRIGDFACFITYIVGISNR